jgi:hypothetical protein
MFGFDFRRLPFEINRVCASLTLFPPSLTNLFLFWASPLRQFRIEILHDSTHLSPQIRPFRIMPRHSRRLLPKGIGNRPLVGPALTQDDRDGVSQAIEG